MNRFFFFLFVNIVFLPEVIGQQGILQSMRFKADKKTEMEVISSQKEATYFSRMEVTESGSIAKPIISEMSLVKMDRNLKPVYEVKLPRPDDDFALNEIQSLDKQLYLFGRKWDKKNDRHQNYIAKIDKETGKRGEFVPFGQVQGFTINYYLYETVPSWNNGGFVMFNRVPDYSKLAIRTHFIDKDLANFDSFEASFKTNMDNFLLTDVHYPGGKDLYVFGIHYKSGKAANGKKRTEQHSALAVYDGSKKQSYELALDRDNRYISSARFFQQGSQVYLAAFTANSILRDTMSGVAIYRIDKNERKAVEVSFRSIKAGSIGKGYVDVADQGGLTHSGRTFINHRKFLEERNFKSELDFKNLRYLPDGSVLIEGELLFYRNEQATTRGTNHSFVVEDIVVATINPAGEVDRLYTIPKAQVEDQLATQYFYSNMFFSFRERLPEYSSYESAYSDHKLFIVFNDNAANTMNTEPGQPVRTMLDERKSCLVRLILDLNTGKQTREKLHCNEKVNVLTPNLGFMSTNGFYLVKRPWGSMNEYDVIRVAGIGE